MTFVGANCHASYVDLDRDRDSIIGGVGGELMTISVQERLIQDIASEVVSRVAPQEVPIFHAVSAAYFANPTRALKQSRSKDSVLGFGLASFAVVLTPAVLQILSEVLGFLTEIAKKAIETGLEKGLSEIVSGMFRKYNAATPSVLTAKQIAAVHDHALVAAKRLRLPASKAELLADAITAELVLSQG